MAFEDTNNIPNPPTQESGAVEQPPTDHVTDHVSDTVQTPVETAPVAPPRPEKEPSMEDFATALETFEQEQAQTEAALNEEQIVTGTVLKVTAQYVLVDVG